MEETRRKGNLEQGEQRGEKHGLEALLLCKNWLQHKGDERAALYHGQLTGKACR